MRVGVVVTTDKVYDNREWPWGYREDEPLGGHDPYSSSKGAAELVTAAYRSSFFGDEGRAVFYSLAEGVVVETAAQAEDEEQRPFNAALWADGELILWNVEMNEDGRSVTLNAEQTRTLCRLLHGQGPEE